MALSEAGLAAAMAAFGVITIPIPPADVPARPAQAPACVFDGRTGIPAGVDQLLKAAASAEAIHIGESHDSAAHHRTQLRILEAVHAARPRVAAGFEMLHSTHQDALDRYLSGSTTAEEFQTEVVWPKTWGYSFDFYRPLFDLLRAHGLGGAALNVPRSIVRKIAVSGIGSLTPQERALLPAELRPTQDPEYLAMLRQTFADHGGDPSDEAALGRYLQAMSAWNEGMADQAADALRRGRGSPLVVIAGGFHAFDAAIPHGMAWRLPGLRQTTIVLADAASCPAGLPAESLLLKADFVWVHTP